MTGPGRNPRSATVRYQKLAELFAPVLARAGRELLEACEVVGVPATRDDVDRILDDAGAQLADLGLSEEDGGDPDAALDAIVDARLGVL